MRKEQIRELKEFVIGKRKGDEMNIVEVCCLIDKWLEQNTVEQVVVGLSDKQANDVVSLFAYDHDEYLEYAEKLRKYLELQTFSRPEVAETVVGLSDEQIVRLHQAICLSPPERMPKATIVEFLKTQTFSEQQSFQPNWNDVPENANFITVDYDGMQAWHESEPSFDDTQGFWGSEGNNGVIFNDNSQKLFKRPKPQAPVVEVGQVWTRKEIGGFSCGVISLNDEKVVIEIKECSDFAVLELPNFFANFERVGGE